MEIRRKEKETHLFYKAGQVVKDEPVKDLVIDISAPIELMEKMIGTSSGWEKKWLEFYEYEGRELAKLLQQRLPGGTFNALLVAMLDRTRCILSIPFPPPPENRVETTQEAFDLIASLIEDINLRQDQPDSQVWDAAGMFCDRLRDQGMERKRFACDYPNEEKDDV